jgi:hypothetical protein
MRGLLPATDLLAERSRDCVFDDFDFSFEFFSILRGADVAVFVAVGEGAGLETSDCAGTACGFGARIVSNRPPIHRKATNAPRTPSAIFTDQGMGSFWRGFQDAREDAIGAANGDPQCKQNRSAREYVN